MRPRDAKRVSAAGEDGEERAPVVMERSRGGYPTTTRGSHTCVKPSDSIWMACGGRRREKQGTAGSVESGGGARRGVGQLRDPQRFASSRESREDCDEIAHSPGSRAPGSRYKSFPPWPPSDSPVGSRLGSASTP